MTVRLVLRDCALVLCGGWSGDGKHWKALGSLLRRLG